MTITDGYGTPLLRKPIFECDKIDNKTGFTDFGLINGMGYYLGDDTGLYHAFTDNTVQNGRTYYYVLVAYDYGIPEVGIGIPPSENTFVLEVDENENIRRISPNVAVVKPHQYAAGYASPGIAIDEEKSTDGARHYQITPEIYDHLNIQKNHTYKVKLNVNAVDYDQTNGRYRSPYDALFLNDGIKVWDVTLGDTLIYEESPEHFTGLNLDTTSFMVLYNEIYTYYHLSIKEEVVTDIFDGLRLRLNAPYIFAEKDLDNTGWVVGDAPVNFILKQLNNPKDLPFQDTWRYYPWQYEIVWTGAGEEYTSRTTVITTITDQTGALLNRSQILMGQQFDFYVRNMSFTDTSGSHPLMDMVIYDKDDNGMFNADSDYVLVGDAVYDTRLKSYIWSGTIMALDFSDALATGNMPQANDMYRISFNRPFYTNDSLLFTVTGVEDNLDDEQLKEDMDAIRVVPNPYVVTNTMEGAVANWDRNQRRQIMFTHIPAQCTIKIFTISGVLINELEVDNSVAMRANAWDTNSEANGTVHWDLRTKEGLEIAAGYYLYRVESKITGDVKVGKFAIIK